MSCPGENTIVAFVEGNLSPDLIAGVEAHGGSCAFCQELLAAALGARAGLGATAGMGPPAPPETEVPRGTSIGRYTVLGLAGRGGMGEVYSAYDPELDRRIALKLLRDGRRESTLGHARLAREAKAMARVSHPNVVSVHQVGSFGERLFVAMEFVDGPTLREWLDERPRTREEILGVFVAAAQGIMAAHDAGFAHRDFKPANVMIGRDGSARVTDFGLARLIDGFHDALDDHRSALPTPAMANLHATLTATGQLMGTPRYMAPEQFKAQATDARTDQFSFCVALYEALYGASPFVGDTVAAVMAEVLAGRVRPAPSRSTVPAWLRRILLRGLSVAPESRWPSMRELVAALAHDPTVIRRRQVLAAGVALIVVLSAVTLARNGGRAAALCRSGPARLAGIWDGDPAAPAVRPRRDVIRDAFLTSGSPSAEDTWERVAPRLDRYVSDWRAMYADACEATHVRGEQPADVLDLRMACLDQGRAGLVALTGVFATGGREVVEKAVDGVGALPPVETCGDLNLLRTVLVPPADTATRRKVEEVRKRIAAAKALLAAGKEREATTQGRELVVEARKLGHRPLIVEALAFTTTTTWIGHDEARSAIEEAIWLGLASSHDTLAEVLAVTRSSWLFPPFSSNPRVAKFWLRLSRALVVRAGHGEGLGPLSLASGEKVFDDDTNAEVEVLRQTALVKARVLPEGDADLVASLNNEAEVLCRARRFDEALRINERVIRLFSDRYGPRARWTAMARSNRGECLVDAGRPRDAVAPLEEAVSAFEGRLGAENADLGYPLTALGRALLDDGRPKEALAQLARAVRIRERLEKWPFLVGESRFALARALWNAGDDRSRAVALAKKARSGYANAPPAWDPAVIDAWLATHQLHGRGGS